MSVVVGVGVIITNENGEVLLGKRFEQCAIREIEEEIGIAITEPQVIGISNNLETYQLEGKHTVSICMIAQHQGDEPKLMEPDKCSEIRWCSPDDLPEPHFEASRNSIALWKSKQFYQG